MWKAFTVAILLVSGTLSAQSPPCNQFTIPLTLADTKGLPVSDLSQEELTVTVGGKPADIHLERVDSPPRVVLALDRSVHMNLPSDVKGVPIGWRLAEQALEGIPRRQLAGIVLFGERTQVLTGPDWETAKARFVDASQQTPHGPAAVFEALETAAGLLQPPKPGDAVLVISAGADSRSNDPEASLKWLKRMGARFFIVGIFEPVAPTPEEVLGPQRLQELAHDTGGIMAQMDEMPRSLNPIPGFEQEMQHYYLLTLRPATGVKNLRFKARIQWKNKSHDPVHLYAPDQLLRCDAP